MTFDGAAPIAVALGIGIALAAAPGPVQAILLAESIRGGIARGLEALAGVYFTFGLLLVALALELSVTPPTGVALRALKMAGGIFLVWLAIDGVRTKGQSDRAARAGGRRAMAPAVRGALAILLNPGGWLFLGVVASPLLATAAQGGGTASALLVALALVVGAALGDFALVMLGGISLSRTSERVARSIRLLLAVILAGLGLWLVMSGALT